MFSSGGHIKDAVSLSSVAVTDFKCMTLHAGVEQLNFHTSYRQTDLAVSKQVDTVKLFTKVVLDSDGLQIKCRRYFTAADFQ
jgi:hypothetical protein